MENLIIPNFFYFCSTNIIFVDYAASRIKPYVRQLPYLYLSGGWTELDIASRSRQNNDTNVQQLLNVPLEVNTNEVIEPSGRNVTKDSKFLIYNRVPKCGSTTLDDIIRIVRKHIQICTLGIVYLCSYIPKYPRGQYHMT